jgi:hypothetical protein
MKHASQLSESIASLQSNANSLSPGAFDAAVAVLSSHEWAVLEGNFWNCSHPLPPEARHTLNAYLTISKTIWHKSGLGQAEPLALYKTTLQSKQSIETALRVLAKIYAGCNLGYCSPPMGFWRAVYALTGYLISSATKDQSHNQGLLNQTIQLWLMAWLNPLSLPPGHLPVAVKLVGILSKICSFTLSSPTHAGSGLAVGDLMSDSAPMSFSRVPAVWEPAAPLYINAQDAAFTIRELSGPGDVRKPRDAYDSLLQSGQQVGLSPLEMQNFVRSAMRKFAYSNARNVPRVGRSEAVKVTVGLIDIWSVLQEQTKAPAPGSAGRENFAVTTATIINHSEGGFLLQFVSSRPLLCVETILCVRGGDSDPWTIAAVRWLDDNAEVVLAGCEVLCNYAIARVAQLAESGQHLPTVTYETGGTTSVLIPRDASSVQGVSQLLVDGESWVITPAAEIGEDWQRSTVLDVLVR